jgi:hypothetical protein
VSYQSYRLKDTEAVIDENDTGKVNGIRKRVKHHFSYSFGGEIALKVLDFLSSVKEAMDLNHVSEGVLAIILPYLLTGEANDGVIFMWKGTSLMCQNTPRLSHGSLSYMRPTRRSTPLLTGSSRPSSRREKEKTRLPRSCADTPRRWEMYTKKMPLFPLSRRPGLEHR